SFSSNTLNSINRSTTVVSNYNGVANRVNKSVENFIDHTESMRVFFKSFLNNQSDFLAFFLCLCVIGSFQSYDLRLDSKDNIISPEIFKDSKNSFWWDKKHYFEIYKLEATNRGREASAYMTVLMHQAVQVEDLKFLNNFFQELNKSSLTSWSLIALLRSTNVYKNQISLWKEMYLYTQNVVINEGLNPKREMYGLDRGLNI
ncbi:hypothetical protein JRA37_003648, partial [Acinetobacter baumannii]|nr:hypothetical protein [Acinetobacter baumannii]